MSVKDGTRAGSSDDVPHAEQVAVIRIGGCLFTIADSRFIRVYQPSKTYSGAQSRFVRPKLRALSVDRAKSGCSRNGRIPIRHAIPIALTISQIPHPRVRTSVSGMR